MQIIDLRSDTITQPTPKMRQAMRDAQVGDDVYEQDPTINTLIERVTKMFKKQAGLFISSGTMSNQIAIMSWCSPGDQIILWEKSHIIDMQNASISVLAGVESRTIQSKTGQLTVEDIQPFIRKQFDLHEPKTSLICLQNSIGNGRIYSINNLQKIRKLADEYNIKIHTDGARIFNVAATLGVDVSQIAKFSDSITFCLSKGLCCPYGSILLGSKKFIQKALYNRKGLGGGIRQGGFLAAAGLVALDQIVPHLLQDHITAKLIAQKLSQIKGIKLDIESVMTNIVLFQFSKNIKNQQSLHTYLSTKNIKFNPQRSDGMFRIITHRYIHRQHIQKIIEQIQIFIGLNQQE